MLKFFGREDTVRDEEVFDGNTKYSKIEFYTNDDTKTGQDIGRPINNIYQNQFDIISYFNEFVKLENPNEGIFAGSLGNEYLITTDDLVQTTVNSEVKNYIRIPPGVSSLSYIDTESDEHINPTILVNSPAVDIAARQIAKILHLRLPVGQEGVTIKYIYSNDSFKSKISRIDATTREIKDYFFGCSDDTEFNDDSILGKKTGAELLTDIYNEADFTFYFDDSLSGDLTKIVLEPFFEITAVTTYYFYYDLTDGEIKVSTILPGSSFLISTVDVTNIGSGSFAGTIDNTHVLINDKKIITATGTTADAIELNSSGGVTVNLVNDFIINGNLVVSGDVTSADELVVADNVITVNHGETGAGVTKGTAGITVDRGTETNYNILFDESTDTFKIGEAGAEQPVATREDSPVDGVGVVWNATNNRFESDSNLGALTPVSEFAYDVQTDFDWSVRDTGQNPIVTSQEAINTNRQDLYEFVELLSTKGANYQIAAGAGLIGCDTLPGITPEGKAIEEVGNLQQMLYGLLNPAVCQYAYTGGTTTADAWNDILFDVTDLEEITSAVLTSGEITLDEGIYEIYAEAVGKITGRQRLRLYNSSNSSVLLAGINSYSDSSGTENTSLSTLVGRITLTATTNLKLQFYTSAAGTIGTTKGTNDSERTIGSLIKITQRG